MAVRSLPACRSTSSHRSMQGGTGRGGAWWGEVGRGGVGRGGAGWGGVGWGGAGWGGAGQTHSGSIHTELRFMLRSQERTSVVTSIDSCALDFTARTRLFHTTQDC